jgi:hypothetical protein
MGWRGFGFVHYSRTVFCRKVPNPNITIRDFFIAVRGRHAAAVDTRRKHGRREPLQRRQPPYLLHTPSLPHHEGERSAAGTKWGS